MFLLHIIHYLIIYLVIILKILFLLQGWGLGWCLMCDILLRLSLSVFVKLINVTVEIPGLTEYLSHPVRRNYLIRSLPHTMRNR